MLLAIKDEAVPGALENRGKGIYFGEQGNKGQILRGTKTLLGNREHKKTCKFSIFGEQRKVTTDTNYHNSCMTKHILPYNFNICYRIYLKLTEIIGTGMSNARYILWPVVELPH